jgi:hypothetical protein
MNGDVLVLQNFPSRRNHITYEYHGLDVLGDEGWIQRVLPLYPQQHIQQILIVVARGSVVVVVLDDGVDEGPSSSRARASPSGARFRATYTLISSLHSPSYGSQ